MQRFSTHSCSAGFFPSWQTPLRIIQFTSVHMRNLCVVFFFFFKDIWFHPHPKNMPGVEFVIEITGWYEWVCEWVCIPASRLVFLRSRILTTLEWMNEE